MRIPHLIFYASALCVVLFACNDSDKKTKNQQTTDLPELAQLDQLKHTEFVPTLESELVQNKNNIYTPALLFAWDRVKKFLDGPVTITDSNSSDFRLLNLSSSFQNSLTPGEYQVETTLEKNGVIIVKSFFNKTLPFKLQLQRLESPIRFNNQNVIAFGMKYFDEDLLEFTRILYYKDDNNFILKLTPEDTLHEIILVKGLTKSKTFADVITQTNATIDKGESEKVNPDLSWKYILNPEDNFSVPIIKFNIAKNYNTLEGQTFNTRGKPHYVETALQRTALVLDENGAIVESKAFTVTDSSAVEPVIMHPKHLVFDNPFFIIIKRKDTVNPYFVMYIENTELLLKEKDIKQVTNK